MIGLVALGVLHCAPVESMQPPDWVANWTDTDSTPLNPDAADFANTRFPAPLGLAQATAIMMLTMGLIA